MSSTVKVLEMTVNGAPYLCPECGSPGFTLDGGLVGAFPADANCDYSHHWTDPAVTTAAVQQIRTASSGRKTAADDDTFAVVVGGTVLAGTLHPQIAADDVKQAGRVYWRRIIKPAVRKRRRAAVRAATKPGKQAVKKVRGAAQDAASATKAAALAAAWDIQAGGHEPDPDYQPEPGTPCGAGCKNGYFPVKSRIHDTTKVRCSVCFGTGEID